MHLATAAIGAGEVQPVDVDGQEFVLWRGADGRLRSAPRQCPHLDHDLVEGHVSGNALVCPGHAWAFDGDGNAYKRNEFGRVDPKGTVTTLAVDEADGSITLGLR